MVLRKQKVALIMISFLIIINIVFKYSYTFFEIMVSYFGLILSISFLPLLRQKFSYSYWIQVVFFGIPMILPSILFRLKVPFFVFGGVTNIFNLLICSFLMVIVLFIIHYSDYRRKLSNPYLKTEISIKSAILNITGMLYSIFSEELYFRFFLIGKLEEDSMYTIIFILFISSILFVTAHYLNKWAETMFTYRNYLSQFIFSIFAGYLFIVTDSLFYPILLHTVYNLPEIILLLKKINSKKYNNKNDMPFFDDY